MKAALVALALVSQTAADTWGTVAKKIVIMPGTSVSAWKDSWRSVVTNGPAAMTAVGDGTYEYTVGLVRGEVYNYLFFVDAGASPPPGLQAFNEYFDPVPTSGPIPASTNGSTVTDTTSVRYGQAGNFDARRILTVPRSIAPGDTLWVFNNLGETPGAPTNFLAFPEGETAVRLQWGAPYGFWGTGGEAFKAADVIAGGFYRIYRSTTPSGLFALVGTVAGGVFTYLDSGLTSGETYYYIIRSVDAYLGGGADSFPRRMSDSSTVDTSATASAFRSFWMVEARPEAGRLVVVQGAREEAIARAGGLVWLSPPGAPPWVAKVPGRMSWVRLEEVEKNRIGGVDKMGRTSYSGLR